MKNKNGLLTNQRTKKKMKMKTSMQVIKKASNEEQKPHKVY